MKFAHRLFSAGHTLITVLFMLSAAALTVFAVLELWRGINPMAATEVAQRHLAILESIGLLTVAVAALELGQTILEEEVQREAHLSAPTRVRRFLSRFMVVVIVALSVETVVSVFNFSHADPARLPQAATVGLAAAALLAAWGVFVRLNRSAEDLEPEAMAQAKREDAKVVEEKK
jgi:hypothetical protein